MAYEHKEGSGALFKNDKKGNDKAPDYRGNVMVGGKVWELAGWVKSGGKGSFLSIAASEPRERPAKKVAGADDTEIPF